MNITGMNCLLVIATQWQPYIDIPNKSDSSTFKGIFIEIFKTTAKKFQLCYNMINNPAVGHGVPLPNGSYNGALGILQRKEADLLVTPASMTLSRSKAVDFSEIVYIEYQRIGYPYPVSESELRSFLKPFSLSSWIAIVVTTFLVACFLWSLFKLTNNKLIKNRTNEVHGFETKEGYGTYLWLMTGLLSQPSPYEVYLISWRLAVAIWLLLGFVICSIYKSNLVAMLTTPLVQIPFETLEDALHVKGLRFNITQNSVFEEALMSAEKGSVLNRLIPKINKIDLTQPGSDTRYLVPVTTGLEPYIGIESAIFDAIHHAFSMYGHCTLTITEEAFLPVYIGMTFQKKSKIKPNFDFVIERMREAGILNHLYKTALVNSTFCKISKGDINMALRALAITDFIGVFILLGTGLAISLIIFLVELILEFIIYGNWLI